MAANDYYYGSAKPLPAAPSQSAYDYDTSYRPSQSSTPAPSYTTQPKPPHQSPFDSVFDDHVYPLDSRQHGSGNPHGNNNNMNPQGTYQDAAYDGRVSPDFTRPNNVEDIPLQSRLKPDLESGNDHVYDAPDSGRPTPTPKKKKGNIRLGQLGMFGADSKRIPWVVYIFSIIHVAVFIGEIVRNATLTGSPIMIKPVFNPMIGPSTWVLINMGARYVPCMHNVEKIQGSTIQISWPCPNSTEVSGLCSLSELCGFGGIPEPNYDGNENQKPEPNQWFRFITPIFLHAGLIHIGFNLLLQLTIGKEMERAIGSLRFFLVYMSAGIFGFVMGGNYAGEGLPSTGASGSLFGIIALVLIDLLYSWQERRNPKKDLLFIILDIVVSFILGLLPGLDNFSHIGGFIIGLGLGICLLHSPNALRRRLGAESSYTSVLAGESQGPPKFLKNPMGFFKGRKPLWWAWWLIRAGCLLIVIIGFFLMLNNFYVVHKTCSWCRYLSCIPISNWCTLGELEVTQTEGPSKRDLLGQLAYAAAVKAYN